MARPQGRRLVMGQDLVAVDATCARLIGLRPDRMPYLVMAGRFWESRAGAHLQRGSHSRRNHFRYSAWAEGPARGAKGEVVFAGGRRRQRSFALVQASDRRVVVPSNSPSIRPAAGRDCWPGWPGSRRWPGDRAFQCRAHLLHALPHRHRLPGARRRGPVDPVVGGCLAPGGGVSGLRRPRACGGAGGALRSDHRRTAEIATTRSLKAGGHSSAVGKNKGATDATKSVR